MNWFLRKLPLIAALTAIVVGLVWLDDDSDFKREIFPARSMHNISTKGASLAYRYLKETRSSNAPGVNELLRMIDFSRLEPDAVVLRLGPEFKPGEHANDDPNKSGNPKPKTTPSGSTAPAGGTVPAGSTVPAGTTPPKTKKKATNTTNGSPPPARLNPDSTLLTSGELKFVNSGGRLVIMLDESYGPIEVVKHSDAFRLEKTFNLWPGVNSVRSDPRAVGQPWPARSLSSPALNEALTVFTLNDGIFATQMFIGTGDVVLIAAPEMFSNSHIGNGDNLKLLTILASSTRPIYFDEFVHGMKSKPGIIELLTRWGMGMALVVMSVGSVVLFWRGRTSLGPQEDGHTETRTQAIDFVNSLAPLYNRALEPHQAIALHYKNFIHSVTIQSGLRGAELRAKIFGLLGTDDESGLSGKRPLTSPEFYSLLKTLNEAYGRLERAHRR